jgi:hypothetical protein
VRNLLSLKYCRNKTELLVDILVGLLVVLLLGRMRVRPREGR